ncbi:MAG: cytochrome c biogenesis protein CcdA, partial [Chloroflexia bacterium]|nr:cytochrome c biogenesis protein CcdA [Chloroflexia bacterium]
MGNVGLLAAFVAGALSISSPCVLPLLPIYLAHLAGVSAVGTAPGRREVLPHALAFVVGFGLVFVLLGVSLGALGGVFLAYRDWLVRAGGAFMVLMGLHLIGLLRLPFLEREHRITIRGAGTHPGRLSSSLLVGVGFAAGWTPCVGPVLGAIFTLAVSAADPMRSG